MGASLFLRWWREIFRLAGLATCVFLWLPSVNDLVEYNRVAGAFAFRVEIESPEIAAICSARIMTCRPWRDWLSAPIADMRDAGFLNPSSTEVCVAHLVSPDGGRRIVCRAAFSFAMSFSMHGPHSIHAAIMVSSGTSVLTGAPQREHRIFMEFFFQISHALHSAWQSGSIVSRVVKRCAKTRAAQARFRGWCDIFRALALYALPSAPGS